MKRALVLRHLAFEDLGQLQPILERAGFTIRYVEVGVDSFLDFSPLDIDLVVILGGPISVYDNAKYPFLTEEISWLRARLLEDLPTLGIWPGTSARRYRPLWRTLATCGNGHAARMGKQRRAHPYNDFTFQGYSCSYFDKRHLLNDLPGLLVRTEALMISTRPAAGRRGGTRSWAASRPRTNPSRRLQQPGHQ